MAEPIWNEGIFRTRVYMCSYEGANSQGRYNKRTIWKILKSLLLVNYKC